MFCINSDVAIVTSHLFVHLTAGASFGKLVGSFLEMLALEPEYSTLRVLSQL